MIRIAFMSIAIPLALMAEGTRVAGLRAGGQIEVVDEMANWTRQDHNQSIDDVSWAAFVLNLDKEPNRLKGFMEAVGKQQPWIMNKMQRVPGVDGRALLDNSTACQELVKHAAINQPELDQAKNAKSGSGEWAQLSPGAVGLYLSHASAWNSIITQNLSYGLIFEDDLRFFSEGWEPAVRSALLGKTQVDIMYLQHCLDSSQWPLGTSERPKGPSVPRTLAEHDAVPCLASYMLSRKAAKQLLKELFPMSLQLDLAIGKKNVSGLIRIVWEPAVAQVGPESMDSAVQQNSMCKTVGWALIRMLGMWARRYLSIFCFM